MAKLPAIHLYPGDWLRDPVSGCSIEAQGLWLRMMFLMHDSDRYGYLCHDGVPTPPEHAARRCGVTLDQYTTLLAELDEAGIPSRTEDGIIFSRRMVRDEDNRRKSRRNGKKGGNPNLLIGVNPPVKGSLKMKMNMKEQEGVQGKPSEPPPLKTSKGVPIPEGLSVPEFLAAWREWEQHLSQKHVRTTDVADRQQLNRCLDWGPATAAAYINHSIAGNYQSIYPDKSKNGTAAPVGSFASHPGHRKYES